MNQGHKNECVDYFWNIYLQREVVSDETSECGQEIKKYSRGSNDDCCPILHNGCEEKQLVRLCLVHQLTARILAWSQNMKIVQNEVLEGIHSNLLNSNNN